MNGAKFTVHMYTTKTRKNINAVVKEYIRLCLFLYNIAVVPGMHGGHSFCQIHKTFNASRNLHVQQGSEPDLKKTHDTFLESYAFFGLLLTDMDVVTNNTSKFAAIV